MNTQICLKIILLLVSLFLVLTILYIYHIREGFNRVNDDSVKNFLRNPGEQRYCPHMTRNLASNEFNIPDLNYSLKLCCGSCFSSIMSQIDNNGIYSLGELSLDDIDELERYHLEQNLEFPFPNLNSYLGRKTLYKNNFPVQLLVS